MHQDGKTRWLWGFLAIALAIVVVGINWGAKLINDSAKPLTTITDEQKTELKSIKAEFEAFQGLNLLTEDTPVCVVRQTYLASSGLYHRYNRVGLPFGSVLHKQMEDYLEQAGNMFMRKAHERVLSGQILGCDPTHVAEWQVLDEVREAYFSGVPQTYDWPKLFMDLRPEYLLAVKPEVDRRIIEFQKDPFDENARSSAITLIEDSMSNWAYSPTDLGLSEVGWKNLQGKTKE